MWICISRLFHHVHDVSEVDAVIYHDHHGKASSVETLHDELKEVEKKLEYIFLISDLVLNAIELILLAKQAYYSKHGVFLTSFQFTGYHALKTQFLHWLMSSFPFERIVGGWKYRRYLACNRFLYFWKIYLMKQWIIYTYPGKIKFVSIVWVTLIYFVGLGVFGTLIMLRIEVTCNPDKVKSFMMCFVEEIEQFSLTIGNPEFMNQSRILAQQPFHRTMFMNNTQCWIPGSQEETEQQKAANCVKRYDDILRRFWTFSRYSTSFGEGSGSDYEDLRHDVLISPTSVVVVSLYYSAQTLTLTGFGDFNVGYNNDQMIFYMILILLSFIINSYISAQFMAPRVEGSKSFTEYHDRLELQMQYLKDKGVPHRLMNDLCHYLNITFLNIAAVDQFLEEVPDMLLREFKYLSFKETLRKSALFNQEPESHMEIVYLLACHVHPLYLPQNATVVQKRDVADMIYIQGDGEVMTKTDSMLCFSGVSQVFGELEDGLSIWSCTVTTLTPSFFLVISKVELQRVLHMYPRAKHELKRLFRGLPDYCCHEHQRNRKHTNHRNQNVNAVSFYHLKDPDELSQSRMGSVAEKVNKRLIFFWIIDQ